MSRVPKLSHATREGERYAKEFGFESLPVCPKKIANDLDISLVAKAPDQKGVSGGIIFQGNEVGIFYSTDIRNVGFQNFTIGHELGHYLLEGHPEEIKRIAPLHISRAGFSEGNNAIELEADHFSAGLLMPSYLVRKELSNAQIGLEGILGIADRANTSVSASAIRAAQCSPYPMAIVVSRGDTIAYGFLSKGFKGLGKFKNFPRKGDPLPASATLNFNKDTDNVRAAAQQCGQTSFVEWFDGNKNIALDEEIIGLGEYGYTLTVFSSDALPEDPDDSEEDEEATLIESWTPKFARGR